MKKNIVLFIMLIVFFHVQATALETQLPDHIVQIGAQDNELIKIGVLDVTLYDGWNGNPVDPTGVQDSTAALQKAIDDAREYQLVAVFPNQANGQRAVYLVSDTLKCQQERHAIFYNAEPEPNVLVGSTKGNGRPIIKLKENTNKFSDPGDPQSVVLFWAHPGHWDKKFGCHWPECEEADISFNQIFRGIDIDLSGNSGAIGIQHGGAQGCAIQDTRIDATGAFAGLGKFGVLGGASYNVEVEGGKYGYYGKPYVCTGCNGLDPIHGYNGHGIIFGSTFRNQEEAAFYLGTHTASPVLVAGFHIIMDSGGITSGNVRQARAGFSMVDGIIETNGGQIFDDGKNLYMRNVYVKGADSIANSWDISNPNTWTQIKEYAYVYYKESNLVDGSLNTDEYRSKTENVDVTTSQLIDSLVGRHRWEEDTFPSFEDEDAVNVKDIGSHSAVGDGVADDTDALKYAIANYDKILLPRGLYAVSDTLVLKSTTMMTGVGDIYSRILPHSSWTPSGETIILTTEDDRDATTIVSSLSVSTDMHLEEELVGSGFTPIEWRAGRNSITRNVMVGAYGSEGDAFLRYHRIRISGNGGGSHYGLLARQRGLLNSNINRALLIEGTNEPIYVYAFNSAGEASDTSIEARNSNNVNIYRSSYEGSKTCVRIDSSENVSVFTSHKNGYLSSNRGGIEVVESDNVLVSNFCFPWEEQADEYALKETYEGVTKTIGNDDNIGLFRRGDPGYTEIITDTPGCNDGKCDSGECNSCPQDCSFGDCCPDGDCNNGETCSTCEEDCGVCPVGENAASFKTNAGVSIDGDPSEWDDTRGYDVPYTNSISLYGLGPATNSQDCSAVFKSMWDDNNLYVLVQVTDDSIRHDSTPTHQDDSVELYLDGGNEDSSTYDLNDYQLSVDANNDYGGLRSDQVSIEHAVTSSSSSYTIEYAMPFSALTSPGIGSVLGFDVAVNDDDDGGDRDSQIVWNGDGTGWEDPRQFGDIVLTHIADTSGNGCIDANELFAFIDLWKQNQAAIGELMEAIGLWKQGCA